MKEEYQDLFRKLGYQVKNNPGAIVYSDLLDDVLESVLAGKSDEQIREGFDSDLLEYSIFTGLGLKCLNDFITGFRTIHPNMKRTPEQLERLGLSTDGTDSKLVDSLILFARYFERQLASNDSNQNQSKPSK